jgi:hypothetical protein
VTLNPTAPTDLTKSTAVSHEPIQFSSHNHLVSHTTPTPATIATTKQKKVKVQRM